MAGQEKDAYLTYLTASELGELLSLSDAEVGRLGRQGILPRLANPQERRTYSYPLYACVKSYLAYRNSEHRKNFEAYTRAKAASERGRAEKLALENAVKTARMIEIESVRAHLSKALMMVRRRLD